MAGETSRENGRKSKGAGGTRVTKALWTAYCERVATGDTKATAARSVGVSGRTLRYHAKHNPEFAEQLRDAELESVGVIEQQIVDIALGKIDKAPQVRFLSCIALLRHRDPRGGWRERVEDDKEPERAPSKFEFAKLTDEELGYAVDALARAVAERGDAPLGVLPR